MSDFAKALRRQAKQPWVKKAEAGERAEGVRDALRAGRGDVRAGARKLHMQHEGLGAQLKRAKPRQASPKKGGR